MSPGICNAIENSQFSGVAVQVADTFDELANSVQDDLAAHAQANAEQHLASVLDAVDLDKFLQGRRNISPQSIPAVPSVG
jgi:hypothetical protein